MKKTVSLFLALCLICLSAAVLAEEAAVPQTYDDLPAAVVVEDVAEFYGTWQAQYAACDGNLVSLEDAAANFGGSLPAVVIDETNLAVSVGEGEAAMTEAHEYTFNEEEGVIVMVDPETEEVALAAYMLEDGSVEIVFVLGESTLSLFMVKADAEA